MKDIILDENTYEPKFKNGDFLVDESDYQSQELLIVYNKGNLIEYPTLGVGIHKYLEGNSNVAEISRAIRETLKQDNWTIETIKYFEDGTIDLNAYRL
jgi:hypothetical protein